MTPMLHPKPSNPYVCGKCGSRSLYREDDRLNGGAFIACQICGNRWPGGKEPVKAEAPANNGDNHAGCVSVSVARQPHQEEPMPTKTTQEEPTETTQKDARGHIVKLCAACGELKRHHGRGLCAKCYAAQVKKNPCANCLRVVPLQGFGLCGGCRYAAEGLQGEARDLALDKARQRFNAPDYNRLHGLSVATKPAKSQEQPASISQIITVGPMRAPGECITLAFAPDDRPLLDALADLAKRQRRDPAQQVLWMIQEALKTGV